MNQDPQKIKEEIKDPSYQPNSSSEGDDEDKSEEEQKVGKKEAWEDPCEIREGNCNPKG